MKITLPVYKDNKGFHDRGLYRTFIYEYITLGSYETLSLVSATYNANDTYDVQQGDLLEPDDPRGIRLLKIVDTLNEETIWVAKTKEDIINEYQTRMATSVVVNNYINTAGGGEGGAFATFTNEFPGPEVPASSAVIEGIGTATSLLIQMGNAFLVEWQKGSPFNLSDLPSGDTLTYKVDKPNNEIYFGRQWFPNERLFIASDVDLNMP